MLDIIYVSQNLPKDIQSLIQSTLGKIFLIGENASLNILDCNDKIIDNAFNIIYVNHSKNITRENNCDYFQPYKNNEKVGNIDINLFLNLIEFHIERLKLSPVVPANFETIFACD
jgi:hypothetical protein